eukprot:120046_1
MPQIVLQLRILWVIEWMGDKNTFEINLQTLAWSICLAVAHLLLECGIIFLDKTTFQLSFMEYSLECLGGRVQWIPFQHLFNNIVPNQLYIYRDNDRKRFNKQSFNAKEYEIRTNIEEDDKERQHLVTFNYEDISAQIKCVNYCASYQFSPQSIYALTQILINCPEMIIPTEFKLSTNIVLQNLFKQILCKTVIHFGPKSFGNVDMISFCDFYQIKTSLISYGDIEAKQWSQWQQDHDDPSIIENMDDSTVKATILANALELRATEGIRLDILRKCYKNKIYLGTNCICMQTINAIIKKCHEKCSQHNSWYFVILFTLLYCKGTIFGEHCSHKKCQMDKSLKNELRKHYIPTYIQINAIKIPFELFEACQSFRKLYTKYVEDILLNKCKHFMISANVMDNTLPVQRVVPTNELQGEFQRWNVFSEKRVSKNVESKMEKLLFVLYNNDIQQWNLRWLDRFVFQSKMNINYNIYLHQTKQFREFNSHSVYLESLYGINVMRIDELIPTFAILKNTAVQLFQIYELKLSGSEIVSGFVCFKRDDVGATKTTINVNDSDEYSGHSYGVNQAYEQKKRIMDYKLDPNVLYLWNGDDEETGTELLIDETNIGLAHYNYTLLHNPDIPSLIIATTMSTHNDLTLEIKYTQLSKETTT